VLCRFLAELWSVRFLRRDLPRFTEIYRNAPPAGRVERASLAKHILLKTRTLISRRGDGNPVAGHNAPLLCKRSTNLVTCVTNCHFFEKKCASRPGRSPLAPELCEAFGVRPGLPALSMAWERESGSKLRALQ